MELKIERKSEKCQRATSGLASQYELLIKNPK